MYSLDLLSHLKFDLSPKLKERMPGVRLEGTEELCRYQK